MGTGKLLMLISETLAVVAVATQFFVPTGMSNRRLFPSV
jgi:hypothetical protein